MKFVVTLEVEVDARRLRAQKTEIDRLALVIAVAREYGEVKSVEQKTRRPSAQEVALYGPKGRQG